jgi:hypothetical protein
MWTSISLFHRAFQFTMCNGPTNVLVCNKTLIQMSSGSFLILVKIWVFKCGYAAAYGHSFCMLYCVDRHVDMLTCLSTQYNMQNEWTYAAP